MQRDINQIPLKPALRARLVALGHAKIDNFVMEISETLSKELDITEEEAKKLIHTVQDYRSDRLPESLQPVTAWNLLETQRKSIQFIRTGCQQLNHILDGGIQLGCVTELCGVPGIGKTQLCMELCVSAQIPVELRGCDGSAVYIDTDGAFVLERLEEISRAFVDRLKSDAALSDNNTRTAVERLSVERILSRIYLIRCHDYFDLVAAVHLLPEFFKSDHTIKLIIVDSVASHFRYAFDDFAKRTKILNSFMQRLTSLAMEKKLAVVVTNQMTTRIAPGEESRLIPALGTSWGYACAIRLNMFWDDVARVAQLFKSPTGFQQSIRFIITAAGVRDVASEVSDIPASQSTQNESFLVSSQLMDNADEEVPAEMWDD